MEEFDYVIVGAGAAGCVLANRLSDSGKNTVVVIEAGGQAADYDMWAQLGCRGWSWSDVLPYFKRAESRIGGSDEVRGRAGPLSIEDQHDPHSSAMPSWRPTRRPG